MIKEEIENTLITLEGKGGGRGGEGWMDRKREIEEQRRLFNSTSHAALEARWLSIMH